MHHDEHTWDKCKRGGRPDGGVAAGGGHSREARGGKVGLGHARSCCPGIPCIGCLLCCRCNARYSRLVWGVYWPCHFCRLRAHRPRLHCHGRLHDGAAQHGSRAHAVRRVQGNHDRHGSALGEPLLQEDQRQLARPHAQWRAPQGERQARQPYRDCQRHGMACGRHRPRCLRRG